MTGDLLSLAEKNIIITGASSGIGKAIAIIADQLGAKLILCGRDQTKLDEIQKCLSHTYHQTSAFDLSAQNYEHIISQAIEKFGKISGFVHSAGINLTLPLRSTKPEHYHQLFTTNVFAGFDLARIISQKKYISETGASFVFLSSIMGILGQPGKIAYCSSKSALIAGMKAMALELASRNIRVNCVLPGVVEETTMTNQFFGELSEENKNAVRQSHPLGLGKPNDVANACAFLLSPASKWITGIELIIDGGYSAR